MQREKETNFLFMKEMHSSEILFSENDHFKIHRCSEGCQCIVLVRGTGQLPLGLPYTISLQHQSNLS